MLEKRDLLEVSKILQITVNNVDPQNVLAIWNSVLLCLNHQIYDDIVCVKKFSEV